MMKKMNAVVQKINKQNIKKGIRFIRKNGIGGLYVAVKTHTQDAMHYQEWFLEHRAKKDELERQRAVRFSYQPKISLLVPVYYTPPQMLRELLDSVIGQTYAGWELCIAVGSGNDGQTEQILETYHKKDQRIRYQILNENGGISENTNAAFEMAEGEFTAFLDHDDVLEPDALFEVAKVLQDQVTDIVYTDEDKVNEKLTEYSEPNMKPDFSIDLLRSQNYITHLFVVRTDILMSVGGFRKEFDGAQDYDVILRCIEKSKRIVHIPKILYHWRMITGSTAADPETKMYCYEAGRKAIVEHFKRVGIDADVTHARLLGRYHVIYKTGENPLVSIIITNVVSGRDQNKMRDALRQNGGYEHCEIIFTKEEKTAGAYHEGAQKAKGAYLLFINGRIEPNINDSISEMLGMCMQKQVGIVGTRIVDRRHKITDAGIILGYRNGIGHAFRGLDTRAHSYMNRAEQIGNYSAVSANVMMIPAEVWNESGGLDLEQELVYAQLALCEKIISMGKRIVFHGFSEWLDRDAEKREDFQKKTDSCYPFRQNKKDPFYNKNMTLTGTLFTLD